MGFSVQVEATVWAIHHRSYSIFALKTISKNLKALLPNQPIRTIKHEGITINIGPNNLTAFLYLPFMLIHEYLHFVIGYFSKNYNLMVLIPPTLDLCYLPLVLLLRFQPFQLWFVMTLYVFWVLVIRLGWNLTGDFAPYLKRKSTSSSTPPH